jgi:hypothetical protein
VVGGTIDYDGGAGTLNAGTGCMETCSGETVTDDCTSDAGDTQDITLTLTSMGASGMGTLTGPGPDGGAITCTYTFSIAK